MMNKDLQSKFDTDKKVISNHACTWLFDLNDYSKYMKTLQNSLSYEEITRGSRIKNLRFRELFYLRKGLTRLLLSHYLNQNPSDIVYGCSTTKKPYLMTFDSVYFNISHSKNYLFIGISHGKEIGVDIEVVSEKKDLSLVYSSMLTETELNRLSVYDSKDKHRFFYKAWTQKEAVSKAFGMGISIGFNEISVHGNPFVDYESYDLNIKDKICSITSMYDSGLYLGVATIKSEVN